MSALRASSWRLTTLTTAGARSPHAPRHMPRSFGAAQSLRCTSARAGLTGAALSMNRRRFSLFSRGGASEEDADGGFTRLGGSRAKESGEAPAPSTRTNAPDRSEDEKLVATLQENNRALAARVEHLLSELAHTQELLQQLAPLVDRNAHADVLKGLENTISGGGGLFLVENSNDLANALRLPGARIVLKKDRLYVLDMFEAITIDNTKVSIIGNNATIVGTFSVTNGATLDVNDACLVAPSGAKPISRETFYAMTEAQRDAYIFTVPEKAPLSSMESRHMHPVVSATSNSQVNLTHCKLSNGRDGIYLGLNSNAYLTDVTVVNCVRGVYEGVNCRVMLGGHCDFIGNYYHLVLLGREKETRARAVMASGSHKGDASNANASDRLYCTFKDKAESLDVCAIKIFVETPVELRTSRADVCIDQNPITDTYDGCWKDNKPITLPEPLRTANLSDPVY